MTIPVEIRTERIILRSWRASDAAPLQPVLEANWDYLRPWIPARVAEPVPLPALEERLAGSSANFDADQEWRFGMFAAEDDAVLGEFCLFPRDATARVAYPAADRVELGYWLRADRTGQGLAVEAARAALNAASRLPRFAHAEIRCDARNVPSQAIPRRLGFALSATIGDRGVDATGSPILLQVWARDLRRDES